MLNWISENIMLEDKNTFIANKGVGNKCIFISK